MKPFEKSFYGEMRRVVDSGARKPLRSLPELADEFGVTAACLRSLLALRSGPKPVFRNTATTVRGVWYRPCEVRTWWKTIDGKQGQA